MPYRRNTNFSDYGPNEQIYDPEEEAQPTESETPTAEYFDMPDFDPFAEIDDSCQPEVELPADGIYGEHSQVRRCRVCGCTDNNCRQCIEKTGRPCHWVAADLCSACRPSTQRLEGEPPAAWEKS